MCLTSDVNKIIFFIMTVGGAVLTLLEMIKYFSGG